MKRHPSAWMVVLAGPLLLGGCGSGGTDCSSLSNSCSSEGQLRCSTGLEAVESCDLLDGCLVWQTSQACDNGWVCIDAGDTPTCGDGCSHECPGLRSSRCLDDKVQTCAPGTDGCLRWADSQDCAASGKTCTDDGQQATCQEVCSSDCPQAGDSRCQGFVLQVCTDDGNDCLLWTDSKNCLDDDLSCRQIDASSAQCAICEPPDIGCGQGEHCVMLTEYVLGCLPAGPGAAGDDCSDIDCEPGLQCFEFEDGYRCRVLCENTSDCDQQSHCIWPWLQATEDWGICRPGCDPIRQIGCNQDEACYFEDPDVGSTLCWTAGNLSEGAECYMTDLCAPGLDCILEPDTDPCEYYCRAYCDPEHPCSGGQSCAAVPPGMPMQKVCR